MLAYNILLYHFTIMTYRNLKLNGFLIYQCGSFRQVCTVCGHVLNSFHSNICCCSSISQENSLLSKIFNSCSALSSTRAFTFNSLQTASKLDKSTKFAEMAKDFSRFSTLWGHPAGTNRTSPGWRMHSLGWVRQRRGWRCRSGLPKLTSNTASVEWL